MSMPYRNTIRALALGLAGAAVVVGSGLGGLSGASAAGKADAEKFYTGKSIKLIVGSSAGSGVDVLARVAARHITRYMPGKPSIVIQNIPKPNSIGAANHIYNKSRADGLTIGSGSAGLFSRAISQPNIRFDLKKMTWLANLYDATAIFWMRTDFPCQTIKALQTCSKRLNFGSTARGSTGYALIPELLKDALGLNLDIVYGYKSSNLALVVERGEADASGGDIIGFFSGRGKQLMDEGKVKILVQVAGKKSPALAKYNVPWVMDVLPKEKQGVFSMVNPILDLARPYYTRPGVPAERVAYLREAFAKVAQDAKFKSEMKKVAGIDISLVRGEDMLTKINQMLNQPSSVRKKVIGLLQKGKKKKKKK